MVVMMMMMNDDEMWTLVESCQLHLATPARKSAAQNIRLLSNIIIISVVIIITIIFIWQIVMISISEQNVLG